MLQPSLYFITLIWLFLACNTGELTIDTNVEYSGSVACDADPTHEYEIYIPSESKECKQLPLLLIIDPHGNGKYAIEQFKSVSEKYKISIASSNLIRNNYTSFPTAINLLVHDIRKKYPVNLQLYIAGFSGGSRMALTYSQYYPVEGVLVSGALAGREELLAINCSIYALIGMSDFNFIEAAQYIFQPDLTPDNLRMEFIDATHQWPVKDKLEDAFGYLYLNNKNANYGCIDLEILKSDYIKTQIQNLKYFAENSYYLKAFLLSQNLAYSPIFNADENLLILYDSLNYDDYLNNQLKELKESIRYELQSREGYYKTLFSENTQWWQKEIDQLNANIGIEEDRFKTLAYMRLKAFLGIMCYSLVDNALQSGNLSDADRLLLIYAILEPKNPDMLFFNAVYAKKTGKSEKAKEYLQMAKTAGFSDIEKLNNF